MTSRGTDKERLFVRLEEDAAHGPESGTPAGTLSAASVAAPLAAYVSTVLLYREHLPADSDVIERVVPDGAVRLVFNLGDAPSAADGPGHAVEAIGASTGPALVRLRGRMEGLSVTLRAGAAAAVLGVPAHEIAGTAVHLDDLWEGDGSRVLERMLEAQDDAARFAVLERALVARLRAANDDGHRRAVRAAELIARSGGAASLRAVAARVNVGERRLQQLFRAHVGLSPKAWSRLSRLHVCLRAMRQEPRACWAQLALDAGYCDQPHFINEFRDLCGITPSVYLEQAISASSKTAS